MELKEEKYTNIKLEEFEGEPTQLDLDLILQQQQQEDLELGRERQVFNSPEEFSFAGFPFLRVIEGITDGALKNLLNISTSKVRLYEVKEDQINLLSCTEVVSPEVKDALANTSFRLRYTLMADKKGCKIQIFSGSDARSLILIFKPQTGELLKAEVADYFNKPGIRCPRYFPLQRPKKTRSDAYLYALVSKGLSTMDKMRESFFGEIGKIRKDKFLRWFNLEKMSRKIFTGVKRRFIEQVAQMGQDLRPSLRFRGLFRVNAHAYSPANPNLTLLYSSSSMAFVFFLLDLDRKRILKKRAFNILDIFNEEKIREYLRDELQGEEEEEGNHNNPNDNDADGGIADAQQPGQIQRRFKIHKVAPLYVPHLQKLFMLVHIKNIELVLRIDDVFGDISHQNCHISKRELQMGMFNTISSYGEDRLVTYDIRPGVKTFNLRPLAWLDPETLEISKIKGFEENEKHASLNHYQFRVAGTCQELTPRRMLVMSLSSIFIFDLADQKILAEERHMLQYTFGDQQRMKNFGDVYFFNNEKSVHVMRSRVDESGKVVVERLVSHHLVDYFPDLSHLQRDRSFNVFRLRNGNYLFLAFYDLAMGQAPLGVGIVERIPAAASLEIDAEGLHVVKTRFKDLSEKVDGLLSYSAVKLISNFFVFAAKLKDEVVGEEREGAAAFDQDRQNYSNLVLGTLDFKILDYCRDARLNNGRNSRAIKLVTSDRVVSVGLQRKVYLHEVDLKELKLNLIKIVEFQNARILNTIPNPHNSPHYYCCVLKSTENHQNVKVIAMLDQNLERVGHLKYESPEPFNASFNSVYALNQTQIAFCIKNVDRKGVVCLADLQTQNIEFVCQSEKPEASFSFGGLKRRGCVLSLGEEKISKIYLN